MSVKYLFEGDQKRVEECPQLKTFVDIVFNPETPLTSKWLDLCQDNEPNDVGLMRFISIYSLDSAEAVEADKTINDFLSITQQIAIIDSFESGISVEDFNQILIDGAELRGIMVKYHPGFTPGFREAKIGCIVFARRKLI